MKSGGHLVYNFFIKAAALLCIFVFLSYSGRSEKGTGVENSIDGVEKYIHRSETGGGVGAIGDLRLLYSAPYMRFNPPSHILVTSCFYPLSPRLWFLLGCLRVENAQE